MKRISISALAISLSAVLFTGCTAANSKRTPTNEEMRSIVSAIELFRNDLPANIIGQPIYPDNYAGYYVEGSTLVFLVTDIEQIAGYQYLKDTYSDIEFKEVKYSYNYLRGLKNEYEASHKAERDENKRLYSYIDEEANRVIIYVDEDTLAKTQTDEDSPLIFALPPAYVEVL